ncbi:MAG TPA: hypothetical protein C5S37_15020 [Methanophagales archaeon]|nr:hypothetical protein [Methanophagales archaeon]
MMLFLGAGASKPFAIETMKEMNEEFENSTDLTKEERELYSDIKNTLGSNNLEDVLTVLNDLTRLPIDPSIRYFGFKFDFFFDKFNKALLELKEVFRELERKKVGVVGVGGAGLNTIDELQEIKIEDIEIIAINTDSGHLNSIRGADKKILIGESLTSGLGAKGSPEVGEKAALLSEDKIKEALEDKDFVFIVAGLGGGTGSGASPIIARIAKEEGAFVVCLVTLPFKAEKSRRVRAKEWLKQLRKEADRVVTFDNEMLFEDVPNLLVNKAFSVTSQLMAINIKGTFEMTKDSQPSIAKKREWFTQKIREIVNHAEAERNYLPDTNLSKKLKSKIIWFIKENCIIKEDKRENIAELYDNLFKIIGTHCSPPIDIFTTNYGLVIEEYIENKKHIVYCDGFNCHSEISEKAYLCDEDDDPFIWSTIWNAEKYDKATEFANELRNSRNSNYNSFETIRFFKLHGSIDQYIQGDEIVKKDILFPTKTVNGKELLESMIYPMREKEVYKDPFFELFTCLKSSLISEKICIVIGYSFGDEHIRNIFFDSVKRNQEIKILFGNRNPDEGIENLEQIKDNIIPIKGEFGEEDFFERLKEELEKCKNNS